MKWLAMLSRHCPHNRYWMLAEGLSSFSVILVNPYTTIILIDSDDKSYYDWGQCKSTKMTNRYARFVELFYIETHPSCLPQFHDLDVLVLWVAVYSGTEISWRDWLIDWFSIGIRGQVWQFQNGIQLPERLERIILILVQVIG